MRKNIWKGAKQGIRNFADEGFFLPGGENLRSSDFDNLNIFQS